MPRLIRYFTMLLPRVFCFSLYHRSLRLILESSFSHTLRAELKCPLCSRIHSPNTSTVIPSIPGEPLFDFTRSYARFRFARLQILSNRCVAKSSVLFDTLRVCCSTNSPDPVPLSPVLLWQIMSS